MKKQLLATAALGAVALMNIAATSVPGHVGREGVVTGHYTQTYSGCEYNVQYRGDFGGDPYLDNGWMINNIRCDDGSAYNYLIVHESDPRYTGNPELAVWGTWEYHVLTASGSGNIVNFNRPVTDN